MLILLGQIMLPKLRDFEKITLKVNTRTWILILGEHSTYLSTYITVTCIIHFDE